VDAGGVPQSLCTWQREGFLGVTGQRFVDISIHFQLTEIQNESGSAVCKKSAENPKFCHKPLKLTVNCPA